MLRIFDKCYKGDGPEESSCLSISAIIALVVLIVVCVIYAVYLLIRAMGISDIAGVHITKNLMLEAMSVQGKLYTSEKKGIKDWIIYEDDAIGYTVKYPNELLMEKNFNNELELKRSDVNIDAKNKSLLYVFVIGKKDIDENSNVVDFIRNKYPEWDGEAKNGVYGGKEGLRTGVFKSVSGIYKDIVCWKLNNKVFYLESKYYLENNGEYADVFDKVISEISIKSL